MRSKVSLASRLLSVLLLLVVARTAAAASVIYVDDDAVGNNNGSSWENAYVFLQDALADVETADKPVEIRVAQGIYTPDQGNGSKPGDKRASFRLINDVAIIGGFAGVGEKDTNTRDIESYETFLSGNLNVYDDPENRENSYHVVIGSYTDQTAILDGFTVTGGNASGYSNPDHYGGGMYNYQGSPVVTRCTFKFNCANIDGGAICNRKSNPVLEHCSFTENSAQSSGGAIYNSNSNPFIVDCVFTQNSAIRSQGGAIYNRESSLEMADCRFEFNTVETGSGGGICNRYSNLKLVACTFSKNSAWLGGGIYSSHCSIIITNSLFTGNFAFPLQHTSNSNMQSISLIPFTGRGGGMYYVSDEGSILINCTVTGNRAFYRGSGIYNSNNERLEIRNCVLWDNQILSASQTSDQISGGKPLIVYNCIQDWHNSSSGNICHDPLFADPGYWANADDRNIVAESNDPNAVWIDGDYHLKSQTGRWNPVTESWVFDDVTSPCIDAGDPNSPISFEPFPNGGRINMGAYGSTAEASISRSVIHAKYGGGNGTAEHPYLIYTAEQMNAIGAEPNDWDKHFKLMADIDLSGYKGADFNIIGYWVNWYFPDNMPFTGVFDGNGHRISNFTYTTKNTNYIGLFPYVMGDSAEIKDLGLVDPNVDAGEGNFVGSLVGGLYNGVIFNCYVQGGSISGDFFVGGLVGDNWLGTLTNCYGEDVSISGSNTIGGLAGHNNGRINICYTTDIVSGNQYVGGLVGDHSGIITYCYAAATVLGVEKVGGLAGNGSSREITCSFWDIETSGQLTSAGGMGKTTVEMKDPNTFMDAGWNFIDQPDGPSDIWAEPEGGGYPILWWQLSPWPELPVFSGGTGKPDNPFLVSTSDELNNIGHNPRLMESHFKLVNNIDLADVEIFIIGSELYPFMGAFDGNGHTVSNFKFTSTDTDGIGLFRYVTGPKAEIKDLGLIEPDIDAGTGSFVGSLIGTYGGTKLTNCYAEGGRVNCTPVRGRRSGSVRHLGGLVGYSCGSITKCYATISVSGGDNVGGLVGRSYGTISNCYATGSVDGEDTVGGLVGQNGHPYFQYDYLDLISNCYSIGSVSGIDNVGGLVGFNYQSDVTASFWDIQTSGQDTGAGGIGKTTAEMQMAGTFLDAGWDFVDETANGTEDIWWILEGQDYPRFWWELIN